MTYILKLSFILLVSFLPANIALADDPSTFQAAEIEHAILTPSDIGGVSTLRLYISNESADSLTILGVKGPFNGQSKIIGKVGDNAYSELGSLPLASEESLDLSSSHMVIQLFDITKPIKEHEKISLILVLANGELPFIAHVVALEVGNATRS